MDSEKQITNIAEYRTARYINSDRLVDRIAFRIYQGDAGQLARGINELELVMEFNRATAVHAFAELMRRKLMDDGYVVISDIDEAEGDFLADELADVRQLRNDQDPVDSADDAA